ncbi:hypothetical protein BUALT_Bualt14G0006700 [Buddleja alternifolia]|uniref:Disease resistance protein RPM1-like n=1 Tax=Buddleja alternifolia TaxID=168488 RepID=A0AAV6WKH3_9LAMI|nr:hypothetical protein BUALT_Bualt14G0006700 [Buddleja alternifolia]
MAESAVSFLVDQLAAWIRSQSELLGGIQENAERIRYEMGQMRAFLRVADEKEEIDLLLKWVKQVREVAYDAEDVMDEFMIRFAGQQDDSFCGFIKRIVISVKNLKFHRELALEMGAILSRLITISEGQQRYKDIYVSTRGQDSRSVLGRGDALLLEDAEVVGIEKPEKQLIEWISSIDSGLKVISVVGRAGSGKSTLVRKVSADPKVKTRFEAHVWLTVSESFKLEELLRNLIRGLVREVKAETPEGLESMNPHEMKEFVYKFLNHKTYIIVLDDVWKLNVWEAIRYMFPRSGSYGSILITTHFHNIGHAASVQTKGYFYNIHPLPLEESKKLFYKMAFMGSSSCPNHLEEVAEIILKRCEGLPLAIVVIGRLLATKNNIEEQVPTKPKEQGFATVADGRYNRWPDRSRRLAIHNNTINDTTVEIRRFDHLRSVIVLDFVRSLSESFLSKLLGGGSRLLRVLELRDPSLEGIPRDVFKLRHLKYLNMEGTKVKIVPKSISNLENLETLNLSNTNVTEFPIQILSLKLLRHLLVYTYEFHRGYRAFQNKQSFKAPYRIGFLSSLQTISDIEAGELDDGTTTVVREIGKLTNLRIEDDPLESVQNLPSLIELELYHTYVGEGLCFRASKFPSLTNLSLLRLEGLSWVKVENGSMPLLQELNIWDCKLMMGVPSGIEHLTNLQDIDFSDMAEEFVEALDKRKLAHVPKVEVFTLIGSEWQRQCL